MGNWQDSWLIVFLVLPIGTLFVFVAVKLTLKELYRRQVARVAKRFSSSAYGPEGEHLVFDFRADQWVIADGVVWLLWRELPHVERRVLVARGSDGQTQDAPFVCKYCGAPSRIDPSDQSSPRDCCHPIDHGSRG